MRTREKIVIKLKQVIITREAYKSERDKYKILGYDEQVGRVETVKNLIEYYSIEEEVLTNLIKALYYNEKFLRELEEKMYEVRKEAEEFYYKEMKKELNIH